VAAPAPGIFNTARMNK